MPPKAKFSKLQIIAAAVDIVRESGQSALSARSLAKKLGTSPQPVFLHFKNMEELFGVVMEAVESEYKQYIDKGFAEPEFLKGVAMKYVQFAKDEPQLFRLLFMSENLEPEWAHFVPLNDEKYRFVLLELEHRYGLTEEKAKKLYNHFYVYMHGLATSFVQGRHVFSMDEVGNMLTEVLIALRDTEEL